VVAVAEAGEALAAARKLPTTAASR
jgi:hypothetical protein